MDLLDSKERFKLDVHGEGGPNYTIPELIACLRPAFELKDYQRVREILLLREEKLKKEIETAKKELNLLEDKHGDSVLSKLLIEDQLKSCKTERDELEEKVAKLGLAKERAEAETRIWRARFAELESRVLRLEEDTGFLIGRAKSSNENEAGGAGSGSGELGRRRNGENLEERSEGNGERNAKAEGSHFTKMASFRKIQESEDLDSEMKNVKLIGNELAFKVASPNNITTLPIPTSSGRDASRDIVEISDSDDEMPAGMNYQLARTLKRKRASSINIHESKSDGDDENVKKLNTPSMHNSTVLRQCGEKTGAQQNNQNLLSGSLLPLFDCCDDEDDSSSSSTDSDEDDEDTDASIHRLLSRLKRS